MIVEGHMITIPSHMIQHLATEYCGLCVLLSKLFYIEKYVCYLVVKNECHNRTARYDLHVGRSCGRRFLRDSRSMLLPTSVCSH